MREHVAYDEREILRRWTPFFHAARLGPIAPGPRVGVDRILHPRSVAVFGASDSKDKFGGRIMHFLLRHGFPGEVYPINLRRAEVLGRRAYPDIGAAPAGVDVAILAVPSESLVRSVSEAPPPASAGACIISTGFAEAGAEGRARQAALVEIVRQTGIRLVGPNCMGLIVPHHRLASAPPWCSTPTTFRDGPIGLVSQSGALMVSIFDRAGTDGIGFRHCVLHGQSGGSRDLRLPRVPRSRTPAPRPSRLYVEGLLDARAFAAASPPPAAPASRCWW